MHDRREMLRPADLAPMLGCTTGRIYQLIAAGVIPATRVGSRSILVPRSAWEAWLREQGERATASIRSTSRSIYPGT